MRFLGHVTDRRGAAMWEGAGGGAGEDTEIPQSCQRQPGCLPLLQVASPGLLTLCWKTGHVGLKLSNFTCLGVYFWLLAVFLLHKCLNCLCKIELKIELPETPRRECLCPLCSAGDPGTISARPCGVWIPGGDLEEIYVWPSSHARWPSESRWVIKARNLLQDSSMHSWGWSSSLLFNKVKNSYKWGIGIRA